MRIFFGCNAAAEWIANAPRETVADELLAWRLEGAPLLNLVLESQTGIAGVETRLESCAGYNRRLKYLAEHGPHDVRHPVGLTLSQPRCFLFYKIVPSVFQDHRRHSVCLIKLRSGYRLFRRGGPCCRKAFFLRRKFPRR